MDEDVVAMSMGERGTGFQLLFVSHPNFRVRTVFGCNREFEVCNMLICLVSGMSVLIANVEDLLFGCWTVTLRDLV